MERLALKALAILWLMIMVLGSAQELNDVSVDKCALWSGETQLRGANVYQRRVYPELDGPDLLGPGPLGPPYTQEDLNRLAAWGANYVNISHPGLFTEEPPYQLDPAVQENLDHLLEMVAQADMFAVISFRTGPGRSEFTFFWGEDIASDPENGWFPPSYYNNRVWGDPEAQDAWVEMWRYTAQRYKDNPIVVGYDLMVEPNSNEVGSYPLGEPLDIWDPEEFYSRYGGTLYDWNRLYPRIVAAIREVDSKTPILIGGNGYSAVGWLPYLEVLDDPCVVYTVHQYEPHLYTHQWWDTLVCTYPGWCDVDWDGEPEPFDRGWLEGLFATIDGFVAQHNVPVAANEFGVMRWEPGADAFIDDEMDLLEGRGMNYVLWLWESSWEPYAGEVDAFNFRHGPDPQNHQDVETSALIEVIKSYWGQNTLRPSTVETEAAFRVTRWGDVYADGAYYCGLARGCFNAGQGADIAKWVWVSEPVEPGDVIEIDPKYPGRYRKSRGAYSKLAAGVVSAAPGVVLGESPLPDGRKALLALRGIKCLSFIRH